MMIFGMYFGFTAWSKQIKQQNEKILDDAPIVRVHLPDREEDIFNVPDHEIVHVLLRYTSTGIPFITKGSVKDGGHDAVWRVDGRWYTKYPSNISTWQISGYKEVPDDCFVVRIVDEGN